MNRFLSGLLLFGFICPALPADETDVAIIAKIKQEGFQNSKVMETVSYLTDVYGPRLLGTPAYREAAEWASDAMTAWGLSNARLENFGTDRRGWQATSFSAELVAPRYMPLSVWPKAWTNGTAGIVTGVPILIDGETDLDSLYKYHGRLAGKIILLGRAEPSRSQFEPFAKRLSDAEIKEVQRQVVPYPPVHIGYIADKAYRTRLQESTKKSAESEAWYQFFVDEGAAVLVSPSNSDHGILHVDGTYFTEVGGFKAPPHFVMAKEHYGRLVRMLDKGREPQLRLHLDTTFYENPDYNVNVLADLPGTGGKLAKELVIVGGHFDSWHAGTGAGDNAAGVAVAMEALRILKATGVVMKRTVRVGLWGGEEQGYWGSRGYVDKHVGNIWTGEKKAEHSLISAYFNFDNGSGKVRGIYLQGNEAVRSIFENYLKPFEYLGAEALAIQNANFTDHEPFDAMNVPAFQFIQDPLNYMTVTHHTNLDLYDYVMADDLKQSAVVVAAVLYRVANRDTMLPRKY